LPTGGASILCVFSSPSGLLLPLPSLSVSPFWIARSLAIPDRCRFVGGLPLPVVSIEIFDDPLLCRPSSAAVVSSADAWPTVLVMSRLRFPAAAEPAEEVGEDIAAMTALRLGQVE
jgi:hypothetical protein